MAIAKMPRRAGGFTLIELMVVIVIATILATIAIPSYQAQIRKSRRTEARTALLDLANREERYFSLNNNYTDSQQALGYGTTNSGFTDVTVGSGYYTVTIVVTTGDPTKTPVVQPGYTLTATATGPQASDTQCAKFTLDQTGTQGSSSAAASTCWH